MESIYSLEKLLSRLPFSILGYHDHEQAVDDFFLELCGSDFISDKKKVQLVSYSFAKLENLLNWGTKSLSLKFFFHALNERYSLLTLNVYYSLRNQLFERKDERIKHSPHLSNNVAIVLSRLFIRDVGFRLSYSLETNWHFGFLEQSNLFSIRLPLSRILNIPDHDNPKDVFDHAFADYLSKSVKKLTTEDSLKELIIQRAPGYKSSYLKFDAENSPIRDELLDLRQVFRSTPELKEIRNEMVRAIMFWHRANPGYINPSATSRNVMNWVELFFQIAFISLVYDSWVEYIPGTCGVQEDSGKRSFRNLGGLILGYRIDDAITHEERGVFRIISARISATVAGQWMIENLQKLRRERNRERLKRALEAFKALPFPDILHGTMAVNDDFESRLRTVYWQYRDVLTDEFIRSYDSLKKNNKGFICKYCLATLNSGDSEECKVIINRPLFSNKNRKAKCCDDTGFESEQFNIPLIKSLIDKLITKHRTHKKTPKLKKEFSGEKRECHFTVSYQGDDFFDVKNFKERLENRPNGSVTGQYLCQYFDAVDCHGILELQYFDVEEKKFVPFFNTREAIEAAIPASGKIILNGNFRFRIPPEDGKAKLLKVIFKTEL